MSEETPPKEEASAGSEKYQENFKLLVESVRDCAIFQLDPDGYISSWNLGAERIKGYRADEIIGKHFSVFYPPDEVASGKCDRELRIARSTGKYQEEGWRVRKDGTLFWAHVVITALRDPRGQLVGFAKVTRDMTDRRRHEEALRSARDDANEANRAKTQFLGRISHEFRTPLTAILGFAELLSLEEFDERRSRMVRSIVNASNHLLALINDVLDITRTEENSVPFALEACKAKLFFGEVVELLQPAAADRGVELVLESDGADVMVFANEKRLRQILLNIVSNAIKYNKPGGKVWCRVCSQPNSVVFEVEDTGIGINAADQQKLFQPFQRLDAEALGIEGMGLGLTLSRHLAETMGGSIAMWSTKGHGSTFQVELPAAPKQRVDQSIIGLAQESPDIVREGQSTTILCVEDNIANLQFVEEVFRQHPLVQLVTAREGKVALGIARRLHPDAILLDLHLPDMSGEEVLASLKADAETAHIPVHVVSADVIEGKPEQLFHAGAASFIAKPYRLKELTGLIDSIERRSGQSENSNH